MKKIVALVIIFCLLIIPSSVNCGWWPFSKPTPKATKSLKRLPIDVTFAKPLTWPSAGLILVLTNPSETQMNVKITLRRPDSEWEKSYPAKLDPYSQWKGGGILYAYQIPGWYLQPKDVVILHRKGYADKVVVVTLP
ncbi:MAG: hypothetical protein WC933_00540 [Candidatus Paceibacterota bacterium]|jgi:hypothetical protein